MRKHMGKGLTHSSCSGIEDPSLPAHGIFISLTAILSSYVVLNMHFSWAFLFPLSTPQLNRNVSF